MDSHDSYKTNLPARFSRTELPAMAAERVVATEVDAPRTLSVRMIFRGLTRYWWQMLLMWMVASAALLTVIYLKVKPSYEAVSLLEATPADLGNIFVPGTGVESEAFLKTQVDLIKSTAVLSAAILDPTVAKLARIKASEDPTNEVRALLDVMVRPDTYLIQVSMRSPSAEEAATIVNAVVNAYIKANEARSGKAADVKIKALLAARDTYETKEKEHSREWKELADKLGNAQLPMVAAADDKEKNATSADAKASAGTRSVTMEEYKEINSSLVAVKKELIDAELELKYMENTPRASLNSRAVIESQVEQALQSDGNLAKLRGEIDVEENRVNNARRIARSENDRAIQTFLKKKAAKEATYREQSAIAEKRIRATIEANRSTPGHDPRADAQQKVARLQEKRKKMEEGLEKVTIQRKQEAGGTVDMFLAQQKLAEVRELKGVVQRRLEQLMFDAKGGAKVIVADKAYAPTRPSSNSRPKLLMATPVGVLVGLMSLFILLEIRSGRIGHPDEIAPRMRAEVFSVPPLPTLQSSRNNRGRGDQVEEFTQRVDHLRVALCGETGNGVARCVLITSAAGGEGKTTLAAQLAGRCANAGLSTLLIDADLRRPRLGQLLDVPEGPGLSDVLSGDAEVESALVVIGNAGGFHLLPAGTPSHDPSRLLRGRRLGDLIGRLRQTFDIVILDTPPVLPVPDALTMGEWVDGAVLAVRRDASKVSLVERANRMLSAKGIPLLGVVVNGVKTSDMGYGGYSGYASYASLAVDANPQPTATTAVTQDE